jgi:hypothetical protein
MTPGRRLSYYGRLHPLLAAGIFAMVGGCADLPLREMGSARLRIEMARRAEAARYAPEALAVSEGGLLNAQREMARQGRRFVWFRDYERVRKLANKAGSDAATAREMAGNNKVLARKAAEQALQNAAGILEQTQTVVDRMPLDRRGHARVASARVTLAEASNFFKKEDFAAVQKRIQGMIADLDLVRTGIETQISQYARSQGRWKHWVDETLAWSNRNSAHAIVVDKVNHRADLY